jgi:hypothetical protein
VFREGLEVRELQLRNDDDPQLGGPGGAGEERGQGKAEG